MNAITVNSFPSIHSFTSARSWFLAAIVLLHVGFFWALSNGLSIPGIVELPRKSVLDLLPAPPEPEPAPVQRVLEPVVSQVYVPKTTMPRPTYDDEQGTAPEQVTDVPAPAQNERAGAAPTPIEMGPEIDHRVGLTQPLYPPAAIRAGETGTVLLSVLVLENGRVGDVRIDSSSGYPRLDDSAVREARRWRLKPGTRDGVPVAMWKQIPVTFKLKDSVKM